MGLQVCTENGLINQDKYISNLNYIKATFKDIGYKYGIERAWVFGSFSRGENNLNSDIDIIIEGYYKNRDSIKKDLQIAFKRGIDLIFSREIQNNTAFYNECHADKRIIYMDNLKKDLRFISYINEDCNKIIKAAKVNCENNFRVFEKDELVRSAVYNWIIAVHESINKVSDKTKEDLNDEYNKLYGEGIDWRGIKSVRNIGAHSYRQFDLITVWGIMQKDVPKLNKAVVQKKDKLFKKIINRYKEGIINNKDPMALYNIMSMERIYKGLSIDDKRDIYHIIKRIIKREESIIEEVRNSINISIDNKRDIFKFLAEIFKDSGDNISKEFEQESKYYNSLSKV